ncbi:MAG: nucleotide exchange factor GrpE [Bacteroidales bacterium]|jgi:molecular chaperone GrpE|nr:nucleotide exchange factor GrpE [Bacteroidales bacterium]
MKKSKNIEKEMSEKNTDGKQQEEVKHPQMETVEDEINDNGEEKINELEQKLRRQIEELKDTNLRLHAEFDNYRKRTIKEKIELSKTASGDVIIDLLPVLDDFDRALKNITDAGAENAFTEGIALIYNKLLKVLSQKGVEEIQAKDQIFDTDFHEAVSHIPGDDPDGEQKIIDVVQKGYKLNGKVIRFAKVVVGS